ncbi:hypothetical protein [Kitasatospora sp. NPDC088548]|uniref:hypothetical protein n=1 Tax=Kitasatospora sp. NPDC088548 TaxID=3364075 RepID=UPI0037FDCBDC
MSETLLTVDSPAADAEFYNGTEDYSYDLIELTDLALTHLGNKWTATESKHFEVHIEHQDGTLVFIEVGYDIGGDVDGSITVTTTSDDEDVATGRVMAFEINEDYDEDDDESGIPARWVLLEVSAARLSTMVREQHDQAVAATRTGAGPGFGGS